MPSFRIPHVRSRGTVVAAAAGALLLASAPAAVAAPVLTVPLDPPDVMVLLLPTGNLEGLEETPDEDLLSSAVAVQWEGSVTVELPEPLDAGTAPVITLEIGHEDDPVPLITHSSTPGAPHPLAVTPLGDGAYDVTMPGDDGVSGDVAVLTVEDVVAEEATGIEVSPVSYLLRLDDAFEASRTLAPQMLALSSPSCPLTTGDDCSGYEATAGDTLELTVPEQSRLRALGFGTLTGLQATLESLDEEIWSDEPADVDESTAVLAAAAAYTEVSALAGLPAGSAPTGAGSAPAFTASVLPAAVAAAEPVGGVLEPAEVQSLEVDSAEPYRATVTVPADTAAGSYVLGLVEEDPDTGSASVTVLVLDVAAAPVAPPPAREAVAPVTAAPVLNTGLRSNTGVVAAPAVETASGGSGTVAVGAGLLLLSGAGGVALVRARRRPADECGA